MFGSSNNSEYTNPQPGGSAYLQSVVQAKVYSGDPVIEKKLTQYQLFWKFYKNLHWKEQNDELLSFNYCRAVIDKVNNFMLGKEGFTINIEDLYGEELPEQVEKSMEGFLNFNWKMNKKTTLMQAVLQMGGICGDAYIFLSPERTKGYIKYTLLDSRMVVPTFDRGDYDKIESYRVVEALGFNKEEYTQKVTEYRTDLVRTYYVKKTGEKADKFEVEESKNPLGIIPIVHIQNIIDTDGYGGFSDIVDIVKLNKVYNEMAQDVKNVIDYYAEPTTVITGGVVGNLKRGLGNIWSGLPAEAQVFNLGLGEDLSASQAYLAILKNAIHDFSGVPEEILSKVPHISNTSAAALQMLYQALIQVADKKSITYGEGIRDLHEMTLVMFMKSFSEDHPFKSSFPSLSLESPEKFFSRFTAVPVWKYNLPNDRLAMLQEAQIELSSGIGSRREIMERLGKKNIPELIKQVEEDLEYLGAKAASVTPEPTVTSE